MRIALIILIGGYILSWVFMFIAFDATPIQAIKELFEERGKKKTLVFFMILPLIFIQAFLEVVANKLEKFIDNSIE